MIIGITGYNASGKDSVAEYLEKKGFKHYSLSDIIRDELKKKKKTLSRENLIEEGNNLRKKYGPSILAKKTIEKITSEKNYIITSIRNKQEVLELNKLDNYILIKVISPIKDRFERIKSRNRIGDPKTIGELQKKELQEESSNQNNQQLHLASRLANVTINNNSDLNTLYNKIELFLKDWEPKLSITKKRKDYIDWDTYFMEIALLSAKRSKDPNTQVGACIVDQNKKIIGIGYNGFPIGCDDDELPWARTAKNINDTKYPYVVHAEANAILNSTKILKNAKIYVALFPCNECAKLIIQSGIKEIIYLDDKYSETDSHKASKRMLDMAKIKLTHHQQ